MEGHGCHAGIWTLLRVRRQNLFEPPNNQEPSRHPRHPPPPQARAGSGLRASLLGPRFSRVEVTLAWRGEGWPRDGFCDLGHHDLRWDVGAAKDQLGLCQADASQQEACPPTPQDQRLVTPCQPVLLCTG